MNIADLMRDLADEVPEFDMADAALRSGRRRRVRAGLAAGAAVVAVLAVTAIAALVANQVANQVGRHHRPTAAAPAPHLPATLALPTAVPVLPSGTAVGRGVLLYETSRGPILLTANGHHYQLHSSPEVCDSLSPDGRWLSYGRSGTCATRDLTSTAQRYRTGVPVGWSADARWLMTTQPLQPGAANWLRGPYQLVELATGRQRAIPEPVDGAVPLGVDTAGRPVFAWHDGPRLPWTWRVGVVDPATDRLIYQAVLALPQPATTTGQNPGVWLVGALLASDGSELVTREQATPFVSGGPTAQTAGDVLTLNLSSGALRQRYQIANRPGVTSPPGVLNEADLRLAAAYPGVVLLTHGPNGHLDAIYTMNLHTGILRRTTRLPAGVIYISLPGQTAQLAT